MADVLLLDVFADAPGHGNGAGVVVDAAGLDTEAMQALAARVGLSETAFLTRQDAGWSLRWFTPTREVDFCGHATLAAAAALGDGPVSFSYAGGTAHVRTEALGGQTVYWLGRAVPEAPECPRDEAIHAALGSPQADRELPWFRTVDGDLLVPLADPATVVGLQPDFAALAAATEAAGVRGVGCLAMPGEQHEDLRVRFFAPGFGVDEDPVTGSLHGVLVRWLYDTGLCEPFDDELRALSYQGERGGRGGSVWLRYLPLTQVAEVGGGVVPAGRRTCEA